MTLATLMSITGCASVSMSENTHSNVWVTASCGPIQNVGAQCRVSGSGLRMAFETPAELQITNSWRPLALECQGELLGSVSTVLIPKPNIVMAGNVLLGGIPGVMVDTATGRGLNYERHVNLHRESCLR